MATVREEKQTWRETCLQLQQGREAEGGIPWLWLGPLQSDAPLSPPTPGLGWALASHSNLCFLGGGGRNILFIGRLLLLGSGDLRP